jgi:hypothetical protein
MAKTRILIAAACGLCSSLLPAADISLSGFGTLGYAQSDNSLVYQRFVDNGGTFKRDSRLGLQVDASLNEMFSATVQGKLAPSLHNDSDWDGTFTWAFASFRPTDDWLIRAGKLRVPIYLHSSNLDVGVTYDFAQLPLEMYSLFPSIDVAGGSVSKSWALGAGDITLDAFWGRNETDLRAYLRPLDETKFIGVRANLRGLSLNLQQDDNLFHAAIVEMFLRKAPGDDTGFDKDYPYVNPPGYYQVDDAIPGPGVPKEETLHNIAYTIGGDFGIGNGYRVMAEYARRDVRDAVKGMDSWGAYASLRKSFGKWTPYVVYSRLLSEPGPRNLYSGLVNNTFAPMVVYQNMAADYLLVYDQYTVALGTSYKLTPTQKLKLEWAQTHVGATSAMVDKPWGTDFSRQKLNVFSASYNFVF